jgi:Co/Zn/Cd efflux system component
MLMHFNGLPSDQGRRADYKRTVWIIAGGTLLFALGEAAWAHIVGSQDLAKDAHGFGYDIALNVVAAFVFGRGARVERLSALVIAVLLAAAGVSGLQELWAELQNPSAVSTAEVATSNLVATAVACLAAGALLRFRSEANPLIKATWLNARNDLIATILTAAFSLLAHLVPVRWPEYALDLIGVVFSFQAAVAVLRAAGHVSEPAEVVGAIRGRTAEESNIHCKLQRREWLPRE